MYNNEIKRINKHVTYRCQVRDIPLVMIALVWGGTLNSSAANLRTAVNGAPSGTLNLKFLRLIDIRIHKISN